MCLNGTFFGSERMAINIYIFVVTSSGCLGFHFCSVHISVWFLDVAAEVETGSTSDDTCYIV